MQEPPGRDYGSIVPGVFHVCGHDLHTAIGVGIASVLSGLRDQLRGTVVFLFQPAEENLQGAAAMIPRTPADIMQALVDMQDATGRLRRSWS